MRQATEVTGAWVDDYASACYYVIVGGLLYRAWAWDERADQAQPPSVLYQEGWRFQQAGSLVPAPEKEPEYVD